MKFIDLSMALVVIGGAVIGTLLTFTAPPLRELAVLPFMVSSSVGALVAGIWIWNEYK